MAPAPQVLLVRMGGFYETTGLTCRERQPQPRSAYRCRVMRMRIARCSWVLPRPQVLLVRVGELYETMGTDMQRQLPGHAGSRVLRMPVV